LQGDAGSAATGERQWPDCPILAKKGAFLAKKGCFLAKKGRFLGVCVY
jgi:hypothetical protein